MSWFSDLFKSREEQREYFPGNTQFSITPYERMGLDILGKYLGSPATGDLYAAGKQQLLDTLSGSYANPQTSPYIKAMTDMSNQNLQDYIDRARASAGARGTYFTKSAMEGENRLAERSNTELNAIIGQWLNQERARQFGAAPLAANMEQYGMHQAPMYQMQASQNLGDLEREIQQGNFERAYQVWSNYRNPPAKAPSTLMSMMGEWSPLIGSYNTHQYGYNTNQTSIADTMKAIGQIMGLDTSSFNSGGQAPTSYTGNQSDPFGYYATLMSQLNSGGMVPISF